MTKTKINIEVLATMTLEELKGIDQTTLTKTDLKKVTKRIEKLEAEKAPKAPTKDKTEIKATIINEEQTKEIEAKKEAIRKFIYGTAGTGWEISPNLLDKNMNTHNKEIQSILETLPKAFNQKNIDDNKGNGNITILKTKTSNNSANQYIIFLTTLKEMEIQIFEGITYPYEKGNKEGIDNRTYTYKEAKIIKLEANTTIQLGMTTNPGKARDYSKKWAQLYKVFFDSKQNDKPVNFDTYEIRQDNTIDKLGKNSDTIQEKGLTFETIFKTKQYDFLQHIKQQDKDEMKQQINKMKMA